MGRKRKRGTMVGVEINCDGEYCGACTRLSMVADTKGKKGYPHCLLFGKDLFGVPAPLHAQRCSSCHMGERMIRLVGED